VKRVFFRGFRHGGCVLALPVMFLGGCSASKVKVVNNSVRLLSNSESVVRVSVVNTSGGMTNTKAIKFAIPQTRLAIVPLDSEVTELSLKFESNSKAAVLCSFSFGGVPTGRNLGIFEPPIGIAVDRKADAQNAGFPELDCHDIWLGKIKDAANTNCVVPRLTQRWPVVSPLTIKVQRTFGKLAPTVTALLYVGYEQHVTCEYPSDEVGELAEFESKIIDEMVLWAN
jgi:hypothetical protein